MSDVTRRLWPLLMLLGLGVLAALVAGCPKEPEVVAPIVEVVPPEEGRSQEPTGEPLKIGGIFAVTGPASALGEPEADTARMLEEQINAEGGIDGRPLQIIIRDTKGDETEGLAAVKELVDREEVLAIVGPSRSGTTLGIIETVEQAEVPLVSCAAASKITNPVKTWVFSTPQSDADAVTRIYGYLQDQDITRIAALTASSGYGIAGLEQLEEQAPDAGLEIVAKEEFADTDTDMTAQLTNIKGTDAQVVICWGIGPTPSLVAKNVAQLQMEIPLIMSHGVANARFIEGAGDAANGVILPAGRLIVAAQLPDDDPQKALLLDYAKQYEDAFGKPADTFGGHAWDAVMLVVEAMRAGATDRAAIRDYIEQTEGFAGIGGVFNFSADAHYGLNPEAFVMVEIVDGAWTLIE